MERKMRTIYHRDGTVTFWSVYEQCRMRIKACNISDQTLSSLSEKERKRIIKISQTQTENY
jgi:hypothetical protein